MDDACARFGLASSQGEVKIVEKPAEEINGIGLVQQIELFLRLPGDLL